MTTDFVPHGIHVPLITPFAADGQVALDALEALAHAVLADGATGLVALGTTGEAAALDAAERAAVTDVCARVCRERGASLAVGAGGSDTRASAAALADLARWPEAGAALVTVPAFVRPGRAGVLAHFAALAQASPVPLIVYHIPYRTGSELDAATLRALGELPGVIGVKYATGAVGPEAVDLLADPPQGFAVLPGDDTVASPMLALGAPGAILASAHLATDRFAELAAAWRAGEAGRARELGHRLSRLSAALFAEPNPTVLKAVLHAQGRIPTPDVRLPLLPAGPVTTEAALKELAGLGA
ncbi:dihydrodipicolinate synthase family protein [Streptomyces sp. NPDC089919]|uniref:dihydrodipicolinate synthase family protein n=1 Tax=Streptomyces sp. NPDC089919 TaxID=3155188 RepID=UPI0034227302